MSNVNWREVFREVLSHSGLSRKDIAGVACVLLETTDTLHSDAYNALRAELRDSRTRLAPIDYNEWDWAFLALQDTWGGPL